MKYRARAYAVIEAVLECAGDGVDVEVVVFQWEEGLTRFAGSLIHQNVFEHNQMVKIRVAEGNQIAASTVANFDHGDLKQNLERTLEMARALPADPSWAGIPAPAPIRDRDLYDEETAVFGPMERAGGIGRLVENLLPGQKASGFFSSGWGSVAIGNSKGVRVFSTVTNGSIETVVQDVNSSGFSGFTGNRVGDLDPVECASVAAGKARESRDPREVDAGPYTVILEPAAVADLVLFLSYLGFGAKSYQEGKSFLCDRIGQKIVDEKITLVDDKNHPGMMAIPFDYEGVPTQRVTLIEKGLARSLVYDTATAAADDVESTGHALPQPNTMGPLPSNLVLLPGDTSPEDMVGSVKRGILVTRFNYTNVSNPIETILTGMTRDGTFLIENGEVVCGIKNMRFTQSILEAMSNVQVVGNRLKLMGQYGSSLQVPHLLIEDFHFTSKTRY